MLRRYPLRAAVVATLALLFAASAPYDASARRKRRRRARGPAFRLLKRIDIDQRTKSPTFDAAAISGMDRGRMAYLGGGLFAEQETFYLLRLRDLRRIAVRAPLHAYLARTPEILPSHARPVHKHFKVQRLLFYDTRNQAAAVEVSDAYASRRVRRHFYLHWDLRRNAFTEATLVARTVRGVSYASLAPIGYDASTRTYYYARDVRRHAGGARTITVVGFASGKPRIVAQFQTHKRLARRAYLDARTHRAFLVEYGELANSRPKGYLVDLRSGKVRTMAIPLTTYGVAFDRDGRTIYAYSAKRGTIWAIDGRSGTVRRRRKVGSLGHELAMLPGGSRLLLLRNSGMQFVDRRRLRRRRFVPSKSIYSGFSHVEGSRVVGRYALLKNGTKLYVLAL